MSNRNQRRSVLQPLFDNEKKKGAIDVGNTAAGDAPLPLPTSGDAGAWSQTTYTSAANINVVAGDVCFLIVVRREIGIGTVGTPTVGGTHTHGTVTAIGTNTIFDTLGVSNGVAQIFACLITGAGTLNCSASFPGERVSWIVFDNLETLSATSLAAAYGTVKSTKATEGISTYSVAPNAATGSSSYLLTLWGGGGDDPGSGYGLGAFVHSAAPTGEIATTNVFSNESGYTGWTDIFVETPYNASSQTFTVTHPPSMASGGMAIFQVELNAA